MPTVALRFSSLPEHVRTARLVAVSVARRAGFGERQLDEIRIAIGEACGRAVVRSENGFVGMTLCDDANRLDVHVTDATEDTGRADVDTTLDVTPDVTLDVTTDVRPGPTSGTPHLEAADDLDVLAAALLEGVADTVSVGGEHAGSVRMRWELDRA